MKDLNVEKTNLRNIIVTIHAGVLHPIHIKHDNLEPLVLQARQHDSISLDHSIQFMFNDIGPSYMQLYLSNTSPEG